MTDKLLVVHIEGPGDCETLNRFIFRQSGLILCMQGSARFTIGSKHYEMVRGDLLIVVLFTNVTFTGLSPDFKGKICLVDFEYVFSALSPVILNSNAQFVIQHPLAHPAEEDTRTIIHLINLIEKRGRYATQRPLAKMISANFMNVLAYVVLDSYMDANQVEVKSSDAKESIMLAFHTHLSRDFSTHRSVGHYARLQNLTPRYFSTAVKAVSGNSPLYWINSAVAGEARRMMRDTKMSIKEIAYCLNFASPTFFTRWYREFTGETPSQYRTRTRITLAYGHRD